MVRNDWFGNLKRKFIEIEVYAMNTRSIFFKCYAHNTFIEEDFILFEHFSNLITVLEEENQLLEKVRIDFDLMDSLSQEFYVDDFTVMLKCLEENSLNARRMVKSFWQLVIFRANNKLMEEDYERFKQKEEKYLQEIRYNVEEIYSLDVFVERNPNGRS